MRLTLEQIKEKLHNELPSLAHRYGVKSLSIFGSYAQHIATEKSDLDLLVTFEETPGLIGFVGLENYLSDLLGVKIDLVMPEALKPTIAKRVFAEAIEV